MNVLEVSHIQAFYGVSQALFDVSLNIKAGEALAVLGRNGMGKTTTVHSICGLLRQWTGDIRFKNKPTKSMASFQLARSGIGLVPEGRRCFRGLTVEENVNASARSGVWDWDAVTQLFPQLRERRNHKSENLSGGEQQMLAISRALATNPQLLILDEATEGLAPIIRQEIWSAIRDIKEQGDMSFLVIDRSLKELTQFADQAVIIERGVSVWQGEMAMLDAPLIHRYLGV